MMAAALETRLKEHRWNPDFKISLGSFWIYKQSVLFLKFDGIT